MRSEYICVNERLVRLLLYKGAYSNLGKQGIQVPLFLPMAAADGFLGVVGLWVISFGTRGWQQHLDYRRVDPR